MAGSDAYQGHRQHDRQRHGDAQLHLRQPADGGSVEPEAASQPAVDPLHGTALVGRKLANLPAFKRRLAATTDRYPEQQAELLDSTIDTGGLAKLGDAGDRWQRRVPGIKLHDDRAIRLLDSLLYTGGLLGNWTTRELQERVLARHRLSEQDYTLGQLGYDLGKLRAHHLAERVGASRRYRLTADGVRLGGLLVKFALGCSVRSSPHRLTLRHRAATIPVPSKRRSAPSITPSTFFVRPRD